MTTTDSHPSCADAISDQDFFTSEILLGAASGIQDAVQAQNWPVCVRILADLMRAKPVPSFCPFVEARRHTDDKVVPVAEQILQGLFTCPDSRGGTITERLTSDFEWSPSFAEHETYYPPKMFRYYLNQHEPLTTLALACWQTDRQEFRDRLAELLLDWVRRVPTWHELLPGGELERQHWQNMMSRNRFEKWLHFYPLIAQDLADRDAIDLLKAMVLHSRLMADYVVANIGTQMSGTLAGMLKVNLKFAILFPETRASRDARESFKHHFRPAVEAVYYPDGGLNYRCTGYHRAVSAWYVQAVQLADELGIVGIDHEREMARRMDAYVAYLMKPEGSLPLLGDTGVGANPEWRTQALGRLKPDTASQAFAWSGNYALRSDWGEDARYLFFTAGPRGTMHNHQDHLSFEVSGHGGPLIVEPGITPYGRTEQRERLASSPAHNTVTVDGFGQHRVHADPGKPSTNPWVLTDRFEFVEGVFDEGFGPDRSLAVQHLRSICFIKPRAFLVVDRLLGDGVHDLVWHFMFYPQSMAIEPDGCSAVSQEAGAPNIRFTWSDPALQPELIAGETSPPYRGLMTADHDRACPSLLLSRKADLPVCVAFLIEPLRPEAEPRLSLEHPDVRSAIEFVKQNTAVPFQDGGASL